MFVTKRIRHTELGYLWLRVARLQWEDEELKSFLSSNEQPLGGMDNNLVELKWRTLQLPKSFGALDTFFAELIW